MENTQTTHFELYKKVHSILARYELDYEFLIEMTEAKEQLLELLQSDPNDENIKFWYRFINFVFISESVVQRVLRSAIKRRNEGRPALNQQDWREHLEHMTAHLNNWKSLNIGDTETVQDQALHTVCRANLAYFSYLQERVESEYPKTD